MPLWIISGLKETFIKIYIGERTNKAEIRPEEQNEKNKAEIKPEEQSEEKRVIRRICGMKYSGKGHKDRNRHKNRIQRSRQARLVYVRHKL